LLFRKNTVEYKYRGWISFRRIH